MSYYLQRAFLICIPGFSEPSGEVGRQWLRKHAFTVITQLVLGGAGGEAGGEAHSLTSVAGLFWGIERQNRLACVGKADGVEPGPGQAGSRLCTFIMVLMDGPRCLVHKAVFSTW